MGGLCVFGFVVVKVGLMKCIKKMYVNWVSFRQGDESAY